MYSDNAQAGVAPGHRLGVPAITLMIVAASAPLTVVGAGATTAYGITNSIAVPIGYVALAIVFGIFAAGYVAMSRHITNAGAFYAYASHGLGRPVGVGVSIVALITYNCMQIGIYGIFGVVVSGFVASHFGVTVPWWAVVFVTIAIIAVMGVNRINLSAMVLGVLVALEFVMVIIFDIAAFSNPAESFTVQPILPATLFTSGIGAVLVFGVAAFMGFEQAAIYSEEAKDPKRTAARATYWAVGIIGIFYAVSTWALAIGVGTQNITNGLELIGPPLFMTFVGSHLGSAVVELMSILFITSIFAALVSFHNAVARYVFALGREGVFPQGLGRVTGSGAPWAGSVSQTILAVVVVAIFAITGSDPVVTLFTWLTNTGAMGLVLLMGIVSLAVIGYFRNDPSDTTVWTRLVGPVIAFVLLCGLYLLILANFNVLLGQKETNALTFALPLLLVIPGIIGIFWGATLKNSKPEVYSGIGKGAPEPEDLAGST